MSQKPQYYSSWSLRYSFCVVGFFFPCEQVKDSDEPESKKSKGSSSPGAGENTEEDETLELDEHPEEVRTVFHAVSELVYLTPFAWFIS